MSVAASFHEQIAAALQVALAAIVFDDSGYNAEYKVARTRWWKREWLGASGTKREIFIRPGEEMHRELATQQTEARMEVFLLICQESKRSDDNPWQELKTGRETGWQVENKGVRDVLKKILSDVTLGGLADNLVADSLIVDRAQFVEGWDVTEVRFSIQYHYPSSAP